MSELRSKDLRSKDLPRMHARVSSKPSELKWFDEMSNKGSELAQANQCPLLKQQSSSRASHHVKEGNLGEQTSSSMLRSRIAHGRRETDVSGDDEDFYVAEKEDGDDEDFYVAEKGDGDDEDFYVAEKWDVVP